MKIGFVGLGAMGKPMAKRLLGLGHQLAVSDAVPAATDELASAGALPCDTPKTVAAAAEIIFLSLPNAAIVSQVVAGDNGLLAGAADGSVIVDLSSVDPATSRTLAGAAVRNGVEYLDAPVSGGVAGAAAGTLTIMVGGKEAVVSRVRPVLEQLGKTVIHVGDIGAGDAIKIVNNLLLGANMAALAEAIVLGRTLGLDGSVMYDVISQGSGRSYVVEAKMKPFILKGNFKPGFTVGLQSKDLGLALAAARDVDMPMPMTEKAAELFSQAMAEGLGNEDISALVKRWERLMGVEVRE